MGTFATQTVRQGIETVMFEANPVNLDKLARNIHSNHSASNATIVVGFLARESGSLVSSVEVQGGVAKDFECPPGLLNYVLPVLNSDDLSNMNLPRPTHIKIDVDGAERDVLSTLQAGDFFSDVRSIYIELSSQHREYCHRILTLAGFKVTIQLGENFWYEKI